MADFRKQLEKAFADVDEKKTGKISTDELQTLLKKLNPEWKDEESTLLFSKLEVVDGKVSFSDFLELFAGKDKKAINPAESKPPSDEEMAVIKDAFKKFDKDGSNQIDLNELKAMCSSLGKALSDEHAAAAMSQLDKDGNMQCSFDEFLLWYTSKPGLGGYNHVALGFIKTKLALAGGIRKIKKRALKVCENTDEFTFRGSVDITPDMSSVAKAALSASLVMGKADGPTNESPTLKVNMSCKDPDAAASIIKLFEECTSDPEMPSPINITTVQDKNQICFTFETPPEMFEDEDMRKALSFLENTITKLEGKATLGVNFEDILKNPDRPLLLHFQGASVSADVVLGLTALVSFFAKEGLPAEMEAYLKVIGGLVKDAKIGYKEANILTLAGKVKEMFRDDPYATNQLQMIKLAMGGLSEARDWIYEEACKTGMITCPGHTSGGGKWNEEMGTESVRIDRFFQLFREMSAGVTNIDSVVVDGIPGSAVQFKVTLEQVNPFPLLGYMVGSYPKPPNGLDESAALQREQSTDERGKLREVFDSYDADKSGSIDLKELKQMIEKLGGKISEEEVAEAMQQLDVNKDSKCNFEEFEAFWSSKPGLGGYGGVALQFMKAKLKAGSMLNRGKRFLGAASGFVGEASAADTYIKWNPQVSPGMADFDEKMNMRFAIEQTDVAAEGVPVVCLKLGAVDAAKQAEVIEKINETLVPVKEMMEAMSIVVEVAEDGEKGITIKCSPPAEMLAQFYEDDEMMKVITPLIKALKQSSASWTWGNDFDDFLAAPDAPTAEVYKGFKANIEFTAQERGKQILLNSLGLAAGDRSDLKAVAVATELVNLFAGAEANTMVGYHKDNLLKAIKTNEMAEALSSLSGSRDFMANMVPIDALEEIVPFVKAGVYILERLASVESVGVTNVDLPVRFAANGLPATVGATLTCTNVKPFGVANYMAEPIIKKFNESFPE